MTLDSARHVGLDSAASFLNVTGLDWIQLDSDGGYTP